MSSHPIQLKWRILEIALLVLIVSMAAVFVHQVGRRLDRRMEMLKTEVILMLEQRIERRISYESVSPSVFGYLGIRELTIFSQEDPDEVLLKISSVKVYYDLFRFITTRTAVLAIKEIRIANSRFEIDYDRDRELLELMETLRTGNRDPAGSLFSRLLGSEMQEQSYPQIDISGTNIELRYTYAEWQLRVTDLFFTVSSEQDLYEISLRGSIEARHGGEGVPLPSLISTRLKITGSLDRFFRWSDLALQIYSLSTPTVEVRRQTLRIAYDSRRLDIRKIQDRAPLDLHLSYELDSKDLSAEFTAEGFQPADLLQFSGTLARFNPYLMSAVTSNGSLSFNLEERALRYSANLRIDSPGESLPVDLSMVTRLSGTEQILYLNPLSLNSSRGRVEFNGNILIGNLMPSGLLRFDDFDPRGGQSVNATLRIARDVEAVAIGSSTLSIGETEFQSFHLDLAPIPEGFRFALAAGLEQQRGRLRSTGTLDWQAGLNLDSDTRIEDMPLQILYRLLVSRPDPSQRLERELKKYSLSMRALASTNFDDFEVSTDGLRIEESDSPDNFLTLQAAANNRSAEVSGIRLELDDYSLRGELALQRGEDQLALTSLLWWEEIPYQVEIAWQPSRALRFSGSYGLEGYYLFDGTMALEAGRVRQLRGNPFRLHVENLPVSLKKGTMYASMDVSGLAADGGSLYSNNSTLNLRNVPFSAIRKNALDLQFSMSGSRMTLDRIRYEDEISTLAGNGGANLRDLAPLNVEAALGLAAEEGQERYSLRASVDEQSVEARLDFSASPIRRTGVQAVNGNLNGTIAIDGQLPRPDMSFAVSLAEGRLNLDPLGFDLQADYSRGAVDLRALNISFLNHRLIDGRGRLDAESGRLSFTSDYRARYFEQLVTLGLDLEAQIGAAPWPLTLERILSNSIDGSMTVSDITVQDSARPGWSVAFSGEGDRLTFNGGPGQSIRGTVQRDGWFDVQLGDPLPIQGRTRGRIDGNQLDSEFDVDALDMQMVNTMTPSTDVFNFTAGSARGSLRIFGPINDPDWVGYLDVREAELEFAPSPDLITPLNGRLIFDGKSFTLPRTTSYSGGRKIEAEGRFFIDHWVPQGTELIFYVEEYPGVHIAYAFDPIFVDGYATGAVRVRTDGSTTRLDGQIVANSCRIALVREDEQTVSSPRAMPMLVEMDITTGKTVEFYWPAMNFPIVRTFARQGEQVELYVKEETSDFFIAGDVGIRGGEIFYFDRSFYLKQGSISFEQRVDEFDPWIYALAEVRERDLNNEEITIYLEADNKLSVFSPRFYSEPSRPDIEILNMIGGTILNRFEQTDFGTAAVMLTSDIVGQFGILSPFERAVRDVLNLDLFTIRTQFLQNVLVGKIREENLVENSINPLDNTTLTLGKYLGTDLFLEALVRFQNVEDFGTVSNIRTEGELNLEWVTPFFLLEWTFTPTHPENLFLSDNSIGLSWKYSY